MLSHPTNVSFCLSTAARTSLRRRGGGLRRIKKAEEEQDRNAKPPEPIPNPTALLPV